MIASINELDFPKKDGKQYATLTHATVNLADMGEKTITTQVRIDGDITPDFSRDWTVEFQGEKYIMPLRIPQGAKGNTSLNATIDLTFQHWAIYQLKRWPFVTIQQIAAGTYLPDEEVATVQLNLKDFCILFGQVLEYYYGGAITIQLNPAWQYKQEATIITISHTKIWDVLVDAFHDKYGVRWEIKAASDNSNTVKGGERYVIRVGYPTTEVDHIFEYGFEGGLLKVERQVQSEEIRNMLKGRGSETNIPFRYFKNTDTNNPDFRPDPDWVEELANIYFPNLMPATFRSYVQGWKAAHISKYPGYTAVGENNAYAPWAYRKGYTDTKFAPVEFVADEITINPVTGDKQVEILPGYSPYVKKGSSLDKYGPLPDTLDNNDDIYPTLQGTGLDIAVAVEQIESDDVAESTENDARIEDKTYPDIVKRSVPQGHATAADASKRTYFTVPTGKKANIEGYAGAKAYNPQNHEDKSALIAELDYTIKVFNATTGEERPASGIPAGSWYFTVEYSFNNTSSDALNVTLSFNSVKITSATPDDKWRNTFDIWVKNIWGSARLANETDSQYSERVWKPVLGDREGNTAKVVFTSGALVHEDYEFTIVGFPTPDTSKTWQEKNDSGVVIATHTSHWRITLAKSDAELEATGLYVPSTKKQGKAGDTFVFIGTEMTHVPYVVDAEVRQADWLKDQLGEVKEIKPTAVVTTDRVRLNNEGKPNALINQLRVGNSLRLFDKRFFNEAGKAYETLYLQSITYTYREPTSDDAALNPDVEIVLGNEYITSANPVSMMQGEISALRRQVGSISNVEQIVRAVGDRLYLRKDGISDRSLSPTQFFSLLTSGDFRAGMIGGAGWGFYKDENGNWVLEADRVNVRQEMQVNTLVINQAEGRGGMEIDTAAYIEGVTRVVETSNGYVCYFDQKEGSIANLFHVDDVAFCNRWTPENAQLKFYKRRVTAVGADSITLSKADVNGTGIPAEGDNIIHFGNYTDATRQYVKVRDVVGGGYERYIEALNSVDAEGVEYYFVGKQAGESRWFVGNKDLVPYSGAGDGSYIEYINRKFNLNNVSLSVNTTIGDKTLAEYIQQVSPPVEQEDIEQFVNNIVDPKLEGIQNQIDGVIETWFYNGVPTLSNYPASGWNTNDLKIQHLGDLYYDNDTGTAYRFSQNTDGSFYWNVITDDAITKALAAAQRAQDTADGKRRVFTAQPTAQQEYDQGDLWVNATYGTQYTNDILRCITHKDASAPFNIAHWTLASKYTDDSALNAFIQRYETEINGYKQQLDGKIDTWYYAYDPTTANKPASDWTTPEDKTAHAGDLFYNTVTKKVFRWTGTAWESMTDPDIQNALDAASDAQDTADNKRRVFMGQPTAPYDKGDLWIETTADGKTLKVCVKGRATGTFTAADWAIADDASLNAFADTIETSLNGIRDQLDQKAETWYQSTDPSTVARPNGWLGESGTEHKGDLWYCTADIAGTDFKKGTTWHWNGTAWEKQDIPQSVFDTIDGKADIFVSKPTSYHKNDLWFLEAAYTLSGTAYKAGTLVVAKNDMKPTGWNANDWTKKDRYTDDTLAQQAKDAADAAQNAADNAQADADAAKNRLDQWAADGVISPTEKQAIKDETARIDADKAHINAEYTRYGLGTPTAYNNAHATYRAQLVALSAATPENITIPSDFVTNQTAYYNARTTALGAIAAAAKKYAGDVAEQEAEKAVAGYKYLKEALGDVTTIAGGLMLSSQIRLGLHNADFTTQTTWAGHNGVYVNGRTPGSWWGGDMLDLFKDNDVRKTLAELGTDARPATSLLRMDGSAYFANGNIGFRADGSGWLGNDTTGIKFDNNGGMIFGSGVRFDVTNVSGLKATLDSLANFNTGLSNLLMPCDASGNELTGGWAEATQSDGAGGIKAKSIKAKVGFWAVDFISAKGLNNTGSGGSGGATSLAMLTDVSLSSPVSGQALIYDGTQWVNKPAGVSRNELESYLTTKKYATQSWVSDNFNNYVLPTASGTQLGGVKVGSTLAIASGILNLGAAGTAGTYAKVTTDAYGRVTAGGSLQASDIPALTIDKTTGLQAALDAKMSKTEFNEFKTMFDSMFVKETDSGSPDGYRIRAKFGFYSNHYVSAKGVSSNTSGGSGGTGGGTAYERLDSWSEYTTSKAGYVLSAGLGHDLYSGQNNHVNNTTVHITAAERTKWNKVVTDFAAITGTDTDTIINKWEEVVAFLDTYTEADTLANLLGNKADKTVKISAGTGLAGGGDLSANRTLSLAASGVTAGTYTKVTVDSYGRVTSGAAPTTLAGYGITDAYTKNAVDTLLANYVTLATVQTISGAKTFSSVINANSGIRIGSTDDLGWYYYNGRIAAGLTTARAVNVSNLLVSDAWADSSKVPSKGIYVKGTLRIGDCEISYDAANGGLHFSKGIYSDEYVSAKGFSNSGGSGGTGGGSSYLRLDDWSDYTTDKAGYVLSAGLGYNLHTRLVNVYGKTTVDSLLANKADKTQLASYYTKTDADNRFVKKTGDTMTGALKVNEIHSQDGAYTMLGYGIALSGYAANTVWSAGSLNFQGIIRSSNSNLQHYRNGVGASTIWDSYNDGSGSGLDADLLDGLHSSAFARGGLAAYVAAGTAAARWVRIAKISTYNAYGLITLQNSYRNDPCKGITLLVHSSYRVHNDGWSSLIQLGGVNNLFTKARIVYSASADSPYYVEVYYNTTSVNNSLLLRLANAFNIELVSSYTEGSIPSGYTSKEISLVNGIVAPQFSGSLLGNATSATKLATARTIWGQSFNGTGNVSGNMTGVGSITASGTIKTTASQGFNVTTATGVWAYMLLQSNDKRWDFAVKDTDKSGALQFRYNGADANRVLITTGGEVISHSANAFRAVYGNYGFIIRNDGNYTYFLLTASGDKYGTWNSLRPFNLNNSNGHLDLLTTVTISTLKIGNCTITYDSTNGGLHVSGGGLYSDSYISAKGASTGVSGGGSGGTVSDRLDKWSDYATSKSGWVLSAGLGYDLHTRVNSLSNAAAKHVTLDTKQSLSARKLFKGGSGIHMTMNTSNAETFRFTNVEGTTILGYIGYHNTAGAMFISAKGDNADFWIDNSGKYQLKLTDAGAFTFNTYDILHKGNATAWLDNRYALKSSLGSYLTTSAAASTYAKLTSPNNLVHSDNEITMVPGEFSGPLWLNYRTTGGLNGNITVYDMGNGNKGYASVKAKGFIKNNSSYNELLTGDGDARPIVNHVTPQNLGWTAKNAPKQIPNINTIAYWNGAHSGTASNLQYCDRGRFGTIVTKNAGDYVLKTGDTMTGALKVNEIHSQDGAYTMLGYGIALSGYAANTVWSAGSLNFQGIIRSSNSNLQHYRNGVGASTIWDSYNDGSGSGLDADLLDGYHATSFARLSSANATVGASNKPVYLSAGTVTAVSSVGEAFLSWGGQNYAGAFGPVDAAIAPRLGANRLAFANPNGTTFQYSTNGGSSWTDYGLTATKKRGFFDGAVGATLVAGKAANGAMTTNHQLRVIINTGSANIYTVLNKFIIHVSTNGVSGLTVTIERALQSTPTSFVTTASNVPLNGWSGFNVVNVAAFATYGNQTTSQYGVIRFTFKCTGAGTNKNPFLIYSIMGFGGMGWAVPSALALSGHLYSYDGDQNATFPAKVTATSFAGSLSGNASSATQLQTARTLWGQSFNGTANVSGQLSGCTRILNASGADLYIGNSNNTGWVLTQDICSHSAKGDSNWSLRANGGFRCLTAGINGAAPRGYNLFVNGRMRLSGIADYYGIWLEGSGFCAEGYSGASWYKGHGALNVGVDSSKGGNNQTSLIVAYKKGSNAAHTGTDRFFDIGVLNDGTMTRVSIMGGPILDFTKTKIEAHKLLNAKAGIQIGNCTITYDSTNSGLHFSTGIYSDGYVSAKGANTAGLSGTILTTSNMFKYLPRVVFFGEFTKNSSTWSPSAHTFGSPTFETTTGGTLRIGIPAVWGGHLSNFSPSIDLMAFATPRKNVTTPIAVNITNSYVLVYPPTDCSRFKLLILAMNTDRINN